MRRSHVMPFGAEITDSGAVRFRLWAPDLERVLLYVDGESPLLMKACDGGWHELLCSKARAGSRYCFQISDCLCVPDPASRFNPDDVHGCSQVIDARKFDWRDENWCGRRWEEAVIYEVHVGAYTEEGTFSALEDKLDHLLELGVTAVELMPVADFPGRRNWGYDGVLPYAPDSRYGAPDDLKRLVQAAHLRGLMIFLDVVYNHFGPEGNYLGVYASPFFRRDRHTPWGAALNFSGEKSRVVRDFYIHNALYWLEEYHIDGLRLDAVHAIVDDAEPDILDELAQAVRKKFERNRHVHLVLENDRNAAHYLRRSMQGGRQRYDAQWNDDLHHALHVLVTGERDGYYVDYADRPIQHLVRCLTEGFAYQGEASAYRCDESRGEPSVDLPPTAFVSFLQNHDQIGNRAHGERLTVLADPDKLRAATALLLLAPSPPLLFMGEEWAAREPFPFFCDFGSDIAAQVSEGRKEEFAGFARFQKTSEQNAIPDPAAESTFERARLLWPDLRDGPCREHYVLYQKLLEIRRRIVVPRLIGARSVERRIFSRSALFVAWRLGDDTRLGVFANFGRSAACIDRTPIGHCIFSTSTRACDGLIGNTLPALTVAWYWGEEHEGA